MLSAKFLKKLILATAIATAAMPMSLARAQDCVKQDDGSVKCTKEAIAAPVSVLVVPKHPLKFRAVGILEKNSENGKLGFGGALGATFHQQDSDGNWATADGEIGKVGNQLVGSGMVEAGLTQDGVGGQVSLQYHASTTMKRPVLAGGVHLLDPLGYTKLDLEVGLPHDRVNRAVGSDLGATLATEHRIGRLIIDGSAGVALLMDVSKPSRTLSSTIARNGDGTVTQVNVIQPGYAQKKDDSGTYFHASVGVTGQINDRIAARAAYINEDTRYKAIQDLTGDPVRVRNHTQQLRLGLVVGIGK